MPIFEYQCEKCDIVFEEIVFGDTPPPPCPNCAGATELVPSCACIRMPAPSRVGQTVTFPKPARSACGTCPGGSCSTCK